MQSFVVLVALIASALGAPFAPGCPDPINFPFIVAPGTTAQTFVFFNYGENSAITLKQSCTYNFTLSGASPFHIKTTAATGSNNDVSTAISNNGLAGPTTIIWTPGTTGSFVYMTGVSSTVFGTITVVANTASCAQYCSDFRLACSSGTDGPTYASQAQCEAACAVLPSDPTYSYDPAMSPADSAQCRWEQADCATRNCPNLAIGASVCGNAGFLGGYDVIDSLAGQCSSVQCGPYCDAVMSACTSNPLFTDAASCLSYCSGSFSTNPDPSFNANTFLCRTQGALTAFTSPTTGCPAASLDGGGVCGTKCDQLCDYLTSASCPGAGTCATTCASSYLSLPTGPLIGSPAGANLECYTAAAANAFLNSQPSYCNFLSYCTVSSSAAIPSSSGFPSSSHAPFSSSGSTGTDGTGDGGDGGTNAAHQLQATVGALTAIVVALLTVFA